MHDDASFMGYRPIRNVCITHNHFFTEIPVLEEHWIELNGPRREKTCLRGVRQSEFQTSLFSYRDKLENRNFDRSKSRYDTSR